MDCLKSVVNVIGQASFLPEKLDHSSLLELAHLTLKDMKQWLEMVKVDLEEDQERDKQYD
jgi:hypothetical protein